MMIESVRLHRFRNYEDQKISFPKATILLYGQNGQGKTNLLESLYLGGIGKSYRALPILISFLGSTISQRYHRF